MTTEEADLRLRASVSGLAERVPGMSAQRILSKRQRQAAIANRAEQHEPSVASAGPAEHCQGRAGALAHHGFEGNARDIDELAHFGAAKQTLRGIGHARGRAVESA